MPHNRAVKTVRRAAALVLPLLVVGFLGTVAGSVATGFVRVPRVSELATYRPDIITQITARDGSTIARYAIERRILISRAEIPAVVRNAIVATEDKNFYQHGGIDVRRTVSALVANLQQGGYAQGGSTLTQQLARAIFLSPQKTISRKVNEALVAFEIERRYSKDQILTMYANEIYLGHGNYGVEAACRYYFGKSVKDVTLAEAALLAGIVQRPEDQSPFRNPELARAAALDGPAADARGRLHHRGRARRGRGGAAAGGAVARRVDRRPVLLRGGPAVPREDLRREGPLPARPARRVDARSGDAGLVRGGARLGPAADLAPTRIPPAPQPDGRGLQVARVLRGPVVGRRPRAGGADAARRRDVGRRLGGARSGSGRRRCRSRTPARRGRARRPSRRSSRPATS